MEARWKTNYGTVPEGVCRQTTVQVIYRDGLQLTWEPELDCTVVNDDPEVWTLEGISEDVVLYRVLDG